MKSFLSDHLIYRILDHYHHRHHLHQLMEEQQHKVQTSQGLDQGPRVLESREKERNNLLMKKEKKYDYTNPCCKITCCECLPACEPDTCCGKIHKTRCRAAMFWIVIIFLTVTLTVTLIVI